MKIGSIIMSLIFFNITIFPFDLSFFKKFLFVAQKFYLFLFSPFINDYRYSLLLFLIGNRLGWLKHSFV